MRRLQIKVRLPDCLPPRQEGAMKRQDFLGPQTITVAAGIPPMGTVFTTVPPVDYRPAIDPQQSLPWAPGPIDADKPVTQKIGLTPKAPHWDCRA